MDFQKIEELSADVMDYIDFPEVGIGLIAVRTTDEKIIKILLENYLNASAVTFVQVPERSEDRQSIRKKRGDCEKTGESLAL